MEIGSILFLKTELKQNPFKHQTAVIKLLGNPIFIEKHEGTPLKNITISCNNRIQKGEAVITKFGLEGNSIYGLGPQIRDQLLTDSKATVFIDFKPSLTAEKIHSKITLSNHKNTTEILKKELKLSPPIIELIKNKHI